jgi:hypothetical protein
MAAGHWLKSLWTSTCHQGGHTLKSWVLGEFGAGWGCSWGTGWYSASLGLLTGRQAGPQSLRTDFLRHSTCSFFFWTKGKASFAWVWCYFGIRIQNRQVASGVWLFLTGVTWADRRWHRWMQDKELWLCWDHFKGGLDSPGLELRWAASLRTKDESSCSLWVEEYNLHWGQSGQTLRNDSGFKYGTSLMYRRTLVRNTTGEVAWKSTCVLCYILFPGGKTWEISIFIQVLSLRKRKWGNDRVKVITQYNFLA